jgi:putative oxidoreductase
MLANIFTPLSGLWQLPVRLIVGVIMAMHGYQKFFGSPNGVGDVVTAFTNWGIVMPDLMAPLVSFVELVGGICIVLGLFTRYWATMLAVVMVVAIAVVKMKTFRNWTFGSSELELSLMAGCLALLLAGPGVASLEKMLFKKEL